MKFADETNICNDFTRFYYLNKEEDLFVITTGSFWGLTSIPNIQNLDINSYEEVLVSLYINKWGKERDKFFDFDKYRVKNHTLMIWSMPLEEVEKMYDVFMGECAYTKEDIKIGPCCKCGLVDNWNSLGKDNKSYCYNHCSY